MKYYLDYFSRSFMAGGIVAIGGSIFMVTYKSDFNFIGAFLFSFALIWICFSGYKLYTGQIGYLFEISKRSRLEMILTYVGNFLGTLVVALAIITANNQTIIANATTAMVIKNNCEWYQLLANGIMCGVTIWIGVQGYKKFNNDGLKTIIIIMTIMIFILCGFEHCIANMFYLVVSNSWNFESFIMLLLVTIGNSIGSIACWCLYRLTTINQQEIKNV